MPLLVEEVELPSPVDEPDDVALFENPPDDERLDNDVVPTDCIVLDGLGFVPDNDRVLSEPPELNCALIVLSVTKEASFPLPLLPEVRNAEAPPLALWEGSILLVVSIEESEPLLLILCLLEDDDSNISSVGCVETKSSPNSLRLKPPPCSFGGMKFEPTARRLKAARIEVAWYIILFVSLDKDPEKSKKSRYNDCLQRT